MKVFREFLNRKWISGFPAVLLVSALMIFGCKHVPEVIDPEQNYNSGGKGGGGGQANVKDSVCFEDEIKPLLVSNCAQSGCHDDTTRAAGIVLLTHEKLKSTVSGNLLLQSIQDPGLLGMPPAPMTKLSSSQIQTIQQWISQGMKSGVDCNGICDTSNVTFSGTVNPIIQNNCLGCHNSGAKTELTSYANIKTYINNGKISCTINRSNGCLPMPPGAPLSKCKLDQIRIWMEAGAPEN